jgi:Sulfotransferase domain
MIKRGIKHISRVTDVLFRNLRIERDITVFDDDIFLTSFPRSGNTWTRFLVGNLVHQEQPVTFLNLERLVPDMYIHSDRDMRNMKRPRIIKSHECFDPRYKRVLYIVRDPRDVAVSNYHWELKKGSFPDGFPMEEFVPKWMEGFYWPRLGNWFEHVTSWLSTRGSHEGFIVIRYEDLMEDAQRELGRVARLLGIEPTPERLRRAVDLSSADRMRQLESSEGGKWLQTRYTRQDKPFVRSAKSGNWKTVLPEKTVAYLEARWGGLMRELGYALVTARQEPALQSSHVRS